MINRSIQPQIEGWLFRKKVIIIYGARQVGKTTLAKKLLEKYDPQGGYYNCEILSVRNSLSTTEPSLLKRYFGDKKLLVFDEAQFVPDIGRVLKVLIDTFPETQIIATGSSSFDLANKTSEALTGRALQFVLYPFSYSELAQIYDPIQLEVQLDNFLTYGSYPEIVLASDKDAQILLDDLSSKYLYKDILEFENLKRSDIIFKLLQLLALQIGQEVSLNEIANTLQTNRKTVARYIDLLEKSFVIFRLNSFSRNLRKEISKGFKIYFYDIGIRNSIIQQFQPIGIRNDKGAIWENFLVVERLKMLQTSTINPNRYFWRTHDQQEVDYLEEYNGKIIGYELKWNGKKAKIPGLFSTTYQNSETHIIDRNNFHQFLTES